MMKNTQFRRKLYQEVGKILNPYGFTKREDTFYQFQENGIVSDLRFIFHLDKQKISMSFYVGLCKAPVWYHRFTKCYQALIAANWKPEPGTGESEFLGMYSFEEPKEWDEVINKVCERVRNEVIPVFQLIKTPDELFQAVENKETENFYVFTRYDDLKMLTSYYGTKMIALLDQWIDADEEYLKEIDREELAFYKPAYMKMTVKEIDGIEKRVAEWKASRKRLIAEFHL